MSFKWSFYYHNTLIENNIIIRLAPIDKSIYILWRDRLGRPGHNTMLRTMNASHGHPTEERIS